MNCEILTELFTILHKVLSQDMTPKNSSSKMYQLKLISSTAIDPLLIKLI